MTSSMSPVRRYPAVARRVSAVLLMFVASACAMQKPDPNAEPVPPTTLRVVNQGFLDMNIYVLRGAQRLRLGTATGNATTRLTIPASLIFGATSLQFRADPIGGPRASVSQEITVSAGDEVTLQIPPG